MKNIVNRIQKSELCEKLIHNKSLKKIQKIIMKYSVEHSSANIDLVSENKLKFESRNSNYIIALGIDCIFLRHNIKRIIAARRSTHLYICKKKNVIGQLKCKNVIEARGEARGTINGLGASAVVEQRNLMESARPR